MKIYNSFAEINFELKKLHLERKIALEEIKYSSNKLREDLTPHNWIAPIFSALKKFGIYFLVNKFFKK